MLCMLIHTSAWLGRVQHAREWLGRTKEKDTLVVRMEDFKVDCINVRTHQVRLLREWFAPC
jgi:hypothetical protein